MDRFLLFAISLCLISLVMNRYTYHQWMILQEQRDNNNNQRPQSPQQSPQQSLPRRNDGSFSACLLVMDENYRLAEWLSYHYYTFGLRYVIVGIDTRSATSPTAIFQQFRQELNMTIIEWHDESIYMNRTMEWTGALPKGASLGRIRKRYLSRQLLFLTECMTQLHAVGQSWTALWDPDEYLVIRRESSLLPEYEKGGKLLSTANQDVFKNFFLNQYFLGEKTKGSCITIPRVLMGAQKEEDPSPHELLADLNDSQRLTTLRWHFHSSEKDSQINGLTKVAMDASALSTSLPLPTFRNPHRPLLEICGSPYLRDHETSPLRLNHYLGSWHEYSFRNDARKGKDRSYEAWQFRAKLWGRRDQSQVEQWISGFVQLVGKQTARPLLETAGALRAAARNESEWRVNTNSAFFKQPGNKAFKEFVEQGGK